MPSNYMSHKMGDLITSHCSCFFSCPLIPSKPQAAFKQITHFLRSQKSYNGSFTSHFKFKRTFARPHEHSTVNLLAFGLVTRDVQVDNEEEKPADSMQPASHDSDGEKEGPQITSIADTSLLLAIQDDKEGSLAGLNASKVPTIAPEMLQASDMNELSRIGHALSDAIDIPLASSDIIQAQKERMMKKKTQQLTYLFAALASSVGITSLAGASVYCRFAWQMQGGEVPWTEMCGTFSLALGAAVGMEYWARWAHRALWHASLWSMHESHHQPRDGPFELNDVFAIINAIPAIALMAFGFLNKGLMPGLCFGAGLGITVFGIAYMFVHDGLVHRRFPVGPIADVPYFQKVAAAHQLHHADKFNGVPYGLFLGPMELEEVGGQTELEKVLQKRKRENKNPING